MNGKKLLLIEDEEYIRELYQRQLTLAGFIVEGVVTGKEGLAALKKGPYDLVLLDIMLPDTNGIEVLKNIRQDEGTKNTRVVILTNLGQEWVVKEGIALGVEKYIVKTSGTPDQIVQEIKNLFESKPSH